MATQAKPVGPVRNECRFCNGRRLLAAAISTCAFLAGPNLSLAQMVMEVIDLQEGWNAVWLNVEPQPANVVDFVAQQAAPLEIQAIWTFEANRDVRGSSTSPGRWFFYDKDVPATLHTLRTLQGQRAYLIQVNAPGQMLVAGRPIIRSTSFSGRVSNLFGAIIDSVAGPLTFEEFFGHPNVLGKVVSGGIPKKHDIFALNGQTLVRRNMSDPIGPNEAYWVNVVQDFEYAGPVDVTSSSNGLSFGKNTTLRTLNIEIPMSQVSRTISMRARPCLSLSGGDCDAVEGGSDWLEYRDPNSSIPPVWLPLTGGVDLLVPPDTSRVSLDVRARRATSVAQRGTSGGLPAPLVIDILDDQGSRAVIPADVELEPVFGRWVGRAQLTQVSTHPSIQDLPLEQAGAVPMEIALLLELPDPATSGAAPRLLDSVTIPTFRDGRVLQRRFNSVIFDRPVNLAEDAGDPVDPLGASGTLTGTLRILPEDPLNPYRHRYNPEHRHGYDITRQITLKLEIQPATVSDELAGLDGTFGPQRLTGRYTEVITGLTHDAITVTGTFRLERLNGEPASPLQ